MAMSLKARSRAILNTNPLTNWTVALIVDAAVIFMLGWAVDQANAQTAQRLPCGPRAEILEKVEKTYSEVPVAVGLIDGSTVVEVLAREDGDSWTIITSTADGSSCIMAGGKAWTNIKPKKLGPKT